jgi:hypothetical protein
MTSRLRSTAITGWAAKFWDIYMQFTRPIIEVLRSGLSTQSRNRNCTLSPTRAMIFRSSPLSSSGVHDAAYHDSSIRYLAYPHSYSDIRRKYGHAGALLYKAFPDNSRLLNFAYTALRR